MNRPRILFAAIVTTLAAVQPALAHDDDHHDHHRHGHHGKHKDKEKYWDGNCLVERKWKHGEYEEKRKCKAQPVAVQPAPVVVYPPWIVVQQGAPVYQAAPAVPSTGVLRCESQAVGRVLGGIVGGVLGNQIGHGGGRAVATVGGVITGVLVGGEIGRRIDTQNQACVGQVLEFAPAGQRVQWASGPQQYAVVPGQVAPVRGGRQCRSYSFEEQSAQGWRKVTETACRRGDGVWVPAT
ncbi:MAG TPA: glycine zipper 2TM domain-containing protein [Ramlibacter sp.]|jgi:surface antigen|uniref:glycine zipper 2TM domain-containing protein n=1 Tax=Ramlibacter sp. TaxID=1917967 RepID=UPI002D4A245E|nr:glycine zipper 2TM domain-containing protein [Ramlibacter sp.]HZY19256.1 glycine zipper 2TM domain-containing protein [Ramlibacter sp.]